MRGKYERDYTTKHKKIKNKLTEMVSKSGSGCLAVSKIAAELGMDQRTVRAHLKIIAVNNAGIFVDPEEKEFCTREGIAMLAERMGLKEITVG